MKTKEYILCIILGHKWLYSYITKDESTKCICKRCKLKQSYDLQKNKWEFVDVFKGDKRTEEEMIYEWSK